MKAKREICETLHYIKNSFHSAVNAFTALERKHDENHAKSQTRNGGHKTA